ncbi:MAG: sigma-70 family RNA polymerase sigma factor [Vagococcus sp.]
MENDLLDTYHVLLLGALKKCHIHPQHPNFEDYLQIARWTLIETHRRFIREDKEMDSFHNYVYQRIYWVITDELRKEKKRQDRHLQDQSDNDFDTLSACTTFDEDIEVKVLLDTLAPQLSPQEATFLEEAYLNDLSVSAIAKKYNVSRRTVYNWRDKVALKMLIYLK